jgi:hypothetical protein
MTLRISPGGSGVELVPLAALIGLKVGQAQDQLTLVLPQLYPLGPLRHYHQVLVAFHLEMPYMS